MTYQVRLPAKATNSNATEVLDNGKTLKWKLKAGEINKIEFIAEKINILPIAIIVAVVMVTIIVVIVIIILKKKHATKKKNNI